MTSGPASAPVAQPPPGQTATARSTPLTTNHATGLATPHAASQSTGQTPSTSVSPVSPVGKLLQGGIEKQVRQHAQAHHQHHHRRSGKYTHPYGGMRQFAEDRAGSSGWDHECLAIDNLDARKVARSTLADKISEIYKEEFVRVNKAEGKGRPKANNISAAKKTVRMIAERILLSLEAKATQHLFNEVIDKGKESEKELVQLREIHKCGKENPKLTYNEIRTMASAKLNGLPEPTTAVANGTTAMAIASGETATCDRLPLKVQSVEHDLEVEMIKQSVIEMRADQVLKGLTPKLITNEWAGMVSTACSKLVRESYSHQFVPKTKVYGCRHFTRKNRVLMACCGTFPVCRMCHIQDANRIHEVRIEPVHTMLCMMCGDVQPKTQYCRKCNERFGSYYCDVCGITDDTPGYDLRHCAECNVCMPGLTFHCKRCKSCVPATPEHEAVCSGRIADAESVDGGLHHGAEGKSAESRHVEDVRDVRDMRDGRVGRVERVGRSDNSGDVGLVDSQTSGVGVGVGVGDNRPNQLFSGL